jgi:hypothetical protein
MSPVNRAVARLVAGRGRRRTALLLVAIVTTLAFVADPARALPPRCPDGSPPPCEPDDPPPPEPEPEPEPTPTTRPTPPPPTTPWPTTPLPTAPPPLPPPTTIPPPPPPTTTRKVSVQLLVQDEPGGLTGAVNAERYFMWEPVAHPGTLLGPPPGTTLDMIPAGTSPLENNEFTFPDYPLPAGNKVVLRVTEGGSPGLLCRTVPRSALPSSGAPLHILVAPKVDILAEELQAMAAGFTGPVGDLPAGVTMSIGTANLTPQADGLMLQLLGTLTVGAFNYTFDYGILLRLAPSTGTDLSKVLFVQTVGTGTVDLTSVGEPNGDALEELIKAELLPKMRSAVPVRGTPAVNGRVHGDHDVQWWRDQDFHLSIRRVTYSAEGLAIYPSLCRLGG